MFHHDIHFAHTRHPLIARMDVPDTSSAISISVDSNDIVEACTELFSRLPDDIKMAMKIALEMADK